VAVSDDLTVAKIGVRLLAGEDGQSQRRALLKNLKRSAGRLCRAIAPRLDLKRAPELWFSYDDGPDKQRRIEELLSEIELERKGEP
jgi:ribosome-binding factor A